MSKENQRFKTGHYAGNKWGGKFLRAPDIFFTILEKGKGKLVKLGKVAKVTRGFTTGANDFFYIEKNKAKKLKIEKEFLKPLIKTPKECESLVVDESKLKNVVFVCNKDKKDLINTNALEYICSGERKSIFVKGGGNIGNKLRGYNNLETIKNRKRWYTLPNLPSVDVLFRQFFSEIFNYPINPKGYLADHTFYYIVLKDKNLLANFGFVMNSTPFCFFTELFGRKNMGQGVLTTYGPEMKPLLIFDPTLIKKSDLSLFENLAKREIKSIFVECGIDPSKPIREQEPKPLPDRKELDDIIFDELGLTKEERKEVYWAVCELVKNRLDKARSLKK